MSGDIINIYKYREMLKNFVRKELRSKYKGSFLGFFWTFLNPLLMLIVYSAVFSIVLKVNIPNYNYTLFLFIGLVPWMYFASTAQQSTTVIITNCNLIKKVYFPRIILPLSITISGLISMLFTFVIVFIALIAYKVSITALCFYLPLIILIETIFSLALSMILSSITIFFRDLEHIVSIVLMAWFYLTPIVYPAEYIPKEYLTFFNMNPMMHLINFYRDVLMFNRLPDIMSLLYVFVFSTILLIAGYYIFDILQKRFAEEI